MKGYVVRQLRIGLGMTQAELAKSVGISRSRVSQIEASEDVNVTDTICDALVHSLKTKHHIVLGQSPPSEETVIEIPIVGYVPCGTPDFREQQREGYIMFPKALVSSRVESLFFVRATGNSLAGDNIRDGDYMLVERDAPFIEGKIYIIRLGNEVVARHVYCNNRRVKLVSSSDYKEIETMEADLIGRVIMAGKWETK